MTADYGRISETARAVEELVLPLVRTHLAARRDAIAAARTPFVIVDYGAADGANSGRLFEAIVAFVREANPSQPIRLVYVDIADRAPFDAFWDASPLSSLDGVEAEYIRRSFYGPIPGLAGTVNVGYSSTALHWLDTADAAAGLFEDPEQIQANQLPASARGRFERAWRRGMRTFFAKRSRELAGGGLLMLAILADLGGHATPARAAYDYLRDVCRELRGEGWISEEELRAIFIPGYFATPAAMRDLVCEDGIRRHFRRASLEATTVPCAYGTRGPLDADDRRRLAGTLASVVRAWSESSVRAGLSSDHAGLVDEIYDRLADRFFESPRDMPYQYCLMELVRRGDGDR